MKLKCKKMMVKLLTLITVAGLGVGCNANASENVLNEQAVTNKETGKLEYLIENEDKISLKTIITDENGLSSKIPFGMYGFRKILNKNNEPVSTVANLSYNQHIVGENNDFDVDFMNVIYGDVTKEECLKIVERLNPKAINEYLKEVNEHTLIVVAGGAETSFHVEFINLENAKKYLSSNNEIAKLEKLGITDVILFDGTEKIFVKDNNGYTFLEEANKETVLNLRNELYSKENGNISLKYQRADYEKHGTRYDLRIVTIANSESSDSTIDESKFASETNDMVSKMKKSIGKGIGQEEVYYMESKSVY